MLIYMIVWKRFRSRASRHFLISISISDSRREGNYEGFVGIITGLTSNLTYVKHKPGSRMIVLVIIVLSPFLSLKTVLLEIYFMN